MEKAIAASQDSCGWRLLSAAANILPHCETPRRQKTRAGVAPIEQVTSKSRGSLQDRNPTVHKPWPNPGSIATGLGSQCCFLLVGGKTMWISKLHNQNEVVRSIKLVLTSHVCPDQTGKNHWDLSSLSYRGGETPAPVWLDETLLAHTIRGDPITFRAPGCDGSWT